jgi:hypothetical protein
VVHKRPISARDRKVFSTIAKWMTCSSRHVERELLQFYRSSKVRVCVTIFDSLLPELWVKDGGPRLEEMGLNSLDEFVEWLLDHGAREYKRPKKAKYLTSVYD